MPDSGLHADVHVLTAPTMPPAPSVTTASGSSSSSGRTALETRLRKVQNTAQSHTTEPIVSESCSKLHPIEKDVRDVPQKFLMHTRPVHTQPARSLLTRKRRPSNSSNPKLASQSSGSSENFKSSSSSSHAGQANAAGSNDSGRASSPALGINGVEFTGVKHLLFIIVVVGNLRLLAADVRSFGFLNVLKNISVVRSDIIATSLIVVLNIAFLPAALMIELAAFEGAKKYKASLAKPESPSNQERAARKRGWSKIAAAHITNALLCLALSSALCYCCVGHPLLGIPLEANTIVVFLKLTSYALTNRDLRDAFVTDAPTPEFYSSAAYPSNLTFKNLLDFAVAPTLVYQPVYPRLDGVRWPVVLALLVEVLAAGSFVWFMGMHISYRILEHAFLHWQEGRHADLADDFLGLVVVVIILWLLSFFLLFQSALNLIAELTCFADRDFYGPWWNAGSLGAFWRHWNRPVSNYLRRHFYVPLRKRGWSSTASSSMVFLFSAVLHELLFGVPLRTFNFVAFTCMVAQIPLIAVTNPLESMRGYGTTVGNCVFWLSICLGLPAGLIMYYLSWSMQSI